MFTNRIMLMYSFVPSIFFLILFLFLLDTVKEKKIYIYINLHWGRSLSTPPLLVGLATFFSPHSNQTSLVAGGAVAINGLTPTPTAQGNRHFWAPESESDPGYINHAKKTGPVSSTFSRSPAPLPRQDCTKGQPHGAPVVYFTSNKVHGRLETGMKRFFSREGFTGTRCGTCPAWPPSR